MTTDQRQRVAFGGVEEVIEKKVLFTPAARGKGDSEEAIRNLRLLVVDDSGFARSLIRNALSNFGLHDLVERSCAVEAIKFLETDKVDMVLVDYEMPVLNGAEFTHLVRNGQGGASPEVPIILISGHTDMHRVTEARNAGIHEYLAKPFTGLDLYKRIRAIVEKPRPFVRTKEYCGPERRGEDGVPSGRGRRHSDPGPH